MLALFRQQEQGYKYSVGSESLAEHLLDCVVQALAQLRKAAGHGTPHAGPGGPVGEPGEYDWLFDPSWFYSSDTPDRPANP